MKSLIKILCTAQSFIILSGCSLFHNSSNEPNRHNGNTEEIREFIYVPVHQLKHQDGLFLFEFNLDNITRIDTANLPNGAYQIVNDSGRSNILINLNEYCKRNNHVAVIKYLQNGESAYKYLNLVLVIDTINIVNNASEYHVQNAGVKYQEFHCVRNYYLGKFNYPTNIRIYNNLGYLMRQYELGIGAPLLINLNDFDNANYVRVNFSIGVNEFSRFVRLVE